LAWDGVAKARLEDLLELGNEDSYSSTELSKLSIVESDVWEEETVSGDDLVAGNRSLVSPVTAFTLLARLRMNLSGMTMELKEVKCISVG